MRTITTKVYTFDELNDTAKEKAREWFLRDGFQSEYAWESVQEDAGQIGLKIHSLEPHRANEGEFVDTAEKTMAAVLENHGETCETHKTATRYKKTLNVAMKDETGEEYENWAHEFLHDLLEDYRIMLEKEIDYQCSSECVDENIKINDYEFDENGKRA